MMTAAEILNSFVQESYAPLGVVDSGKLIGAFYAKDDKKIFEYQDLIELDDTMYKWANKDRTKDLLVHAIWITQKPGIGGDVGYRAGLVKNTVCYIATDEDSNGKPKIEKFDIVKHSRYVK